MMKVVKGFRDIVASTSGPERTAAVAAWFQSLFPSGARVPVLVGGAAVELYTRGAYRTGDLDFVGQVDDHVQARLEEVGFRRRGRHWVQEESKTFIELPASWFDAPVRVGEVRFREWRIRALSPEDVLVDRLAAWKFWKSAPDGVNAFLVWRDRGGEMDAEYLESRAEREQVMDALEAVRELADRAPEGEKGIAEAERWARRAR